MSRKIDLIGEKFGRLTVISCAGSNAEGRAMFLCECECGNQICTTGKLLRKGATKSCGCLNHERLIKRNQVHGCARRDNTERLYKVWLSMHARVHNPKSNVYKHYGGRGIRICREWDCNYEAFRTWAMEHGYDPTAPRGKCTLDRIDPDGDYCPQNCRWVDMHVQNRNKRERK